MGLVAAQGWMQFQGPKAQDIYRPSLHQDPPSTAQLVAVQLNSKGFSDVVLVIARNKEELETWSADLLARSSVMVLRMVGSPPKEVVTV